MNPIYTFNDTSIEIKIIDEECNHYKKDIPNNDINKDLIENTIFKFEKSGAQTIIMHDDIHVFQLSKMECNYSEFIEIKKQLDDTQKYNDLLNSKITDKEELQQQINIYYDKELDRLEQELNNNDDLLQQQIKLFSDKSIADKKDIDAINSKLNNTDSLLQQQMKLFNNKSLSDKKEIDTINSKLNNTDCLLQQQIETMNSKLNNTNNLLQQQIEMLKDKHKKEIDTINSKLNNTDSLLQKQNNYYLPFVFIVGLEYVTHYGNKQIVTFNEEYNKEWIGFFNSQKDVKLIPKITKITNIRLFHTYVYIIIPPEKVLISISGGEYSLKVYNKGIHYNIHTGNLIMLINEKNIDNIIALYKKEQTIQIFGILNITYIESECLQE